MGTIGNMGHSSVQCAVMPVKVGKISLQCPYGSIGTIYDFGINLTDETASNCAASDEEGKFCMPDSNDLQTKLNAATG